MSRQCVQRAALLCFLCGEKNEEDKHKPAVEEGGESAAVRLNQKRKRYTSAARFARGLTKLLRHEARQRGLPLRPDGFVPLSSVLALKENKAFSLADALSAVAQDQKHRFQLAASQVPKSSEDSQGVRTPQENSEGQLPLTILPAGEICCMRCASTGPPLFIRATQGHSLSGIENELFLTPICSSRDLEEAVSRCTYTEEEPPAPSRGITLVHGTYLRFFHSIKKEGLKRMQRRHVHFTPFPGKALKEGLSFFLSANNVILTEGDAQGAVPFACFAAAVERHSGRLLT
ncbi:hypothetical protein Esti_001961 [Eimeria stiedai]